MVDHDQSEGHDVRYDYVGFNADQPRLTCCNPECHTATLFAHHMDQDPFNQAVREFLTVHPPKGDFIPDYDRAGPPLSVSELMS